LNNKTRPSLIILLGPTGVGKTALSITIANHFHTEIISCDSRQLFKEMQIGTAVPEEELLKQIPHHFIQSNSIFGSYNAAMFETEVLERLTILFAIHPVVLMTGGSMLYIDVVCKGIDDLPDVDTELRATLMDRMKAEGIERMRAELKLLDPVYYHEVDLQNPVRIIHALEICYMTGKPFSSQRTKTAKQRAFNILKIGLNRDRTELYDRINSRVDEMMADGLEEEARSLYPFMELNTLNTVGYREMFDYFDGNCKLEDAVEKIKANSRKYARKQLTWFRKDPDIHWFHPDQEAEILKLITDYKLQIKD
jgi:tRNA dimethylallyltransferase